MYRHEANGDDVFLDEWTVPWRKKRGGTYYELDNGELEKTVFDELPWPGSILSEDQLHLMEEEARRIFLGTEKAVYCDYVGPCVFERSWYLRGLNNFLMDLVSDEASAERYLDRVFELQLGAYKRIVETLGPYIDGFFVIDDVAMQSGPLISLDLYRKMIKPYHRRIFDYIHSRGKKVIYHCCGSLAEFIPDFLDAGIDALNPLQLSARNMDPVALKQNFGKDLVFWGGGVNTQETLAFGTPAEVRDEVLRRTEILGKGGGYVFAAEHCIQPGTPAENVLAIFETLRSG